MTSRIIHSGLFVDLRNESTTFSRFAYFNFFCADGLAAHLVAQLLPRASRH